MVLVGGGSFIMGSEEGDTDERPMHEVTVGSFYIDVHEVTNAQFEAFLAATGRAAPPFWKPDFDRPSDPVVGVTWNEAEAYASWAGKRLPTEAEWEWACRAGSQDTYPWGDDLEERYGNFGSFGIAPVKSFMPNGHGLYDMIGNVWEWCSDWYSEDYYLESTANNPRGPVVGTHKVLRGGAWYSDGTETRTANRYYALPDARSFHIGFRCVKPVK